MVEPGYPSSRRGAVRNTADRPMIFAREREIPERQSEPAALLPWKLLIVDDEEEVHSLTRLVLRNYEFEGRPLKLMSAYSGVAARQVLAEHPDIALILLDVVMEREDSGLQLVHHIRNKLQNNRVRIILRTGQPGQAPEMEVVARYDINDYKAKTDLTSQKLFTTVTSALRAWRDIQTIDFSRQGLQRVIQASGGLFEWQSRTQFGRSVLKDLVSLAEPVPLAAAGGDVETTISGVVARRIDGAFKIVGGVGEFAGDSGRVLTEVVPDRTELMVLQASRRGEGLFFNHSYVSCIRADNGEEILFLIQGSGGHGGLGGVDGDLIQLFMGNVATAFHNVNLSLEVIETQKEVIQTLGEVVETRSRETANHVLRVGKMAHLLAIKAGLESQEAQILRMAAPMHDVGKVGVPDAILNKPGPLTADEYRIMQTHAAIGFEILGKSERPLLRAAALVAGQHHEKWDGSGYPEGLQGEDIHIFGRITALVDVFDAMASRRVYRAAMDLGEVLQVIREGRGTHFDPELADIFLGNLAEFVGIIRAHPDQAESEPCQSQEGQSQA